jgi:hypothetical protein
MFSRTDLLGFLQHSSELTRKSKVKFSPQEDALLLRLVAGRKVMDWMDVASQMGSRSARQCRERYTNYLDPNLSNAIWTPDEDRLLGDKVKRLGTRWNAMAEFFKNRSVISLRNRWRLLERHRTKRETPEHGTEAASRSHDEVADPPSKVADVISLKPAKVPRTETKMFDEPFELFQTSHQRAAFDDDPFCRWTID